MEQVVQLLDLLLVQLDPHAAVGQQAGTYPGLPEVPGPRHAADGLHPEVLHHRLDLPDSAPGPGDPLVHRCPGAGGQAAALGQHVTQVHLLFTGLGLLAPNIMGFFSTYFLTLLMYLMFPMTTKHVLYL